MIDLPNLETAASRLGGEQSGGEILCPGPNHSEADRSLAVKLDDAAPDGFVVHSFAGDDEIECRDHVRRKLRLPAFEPHAKKNGGGAPWKTISEHVYRDEAGVPYFRVRKCLDGEGKKQYPQSHWAGGQWVKGKPQGPKIPYRLPELLAAPRSAIVYVVEGEKCADALAKLGFVPTTNSEGAEDGKGKKWTSDLNKYFKGRNVVIVGDNDQPGRKHVQQVAKNLHGIAESVRVLDLADHWPGDPMPVGDDVVDWIGQHDRAGSRLAALAKDAPPWEPEGKPTGGAARDGDDAEHREADAEIARLAGLSPVQYERERKAAAVRLGCRASILDKLVGVERTRLGLSGRGDGLQGSIVAFEEIEPWPERVDGAQLLDDIASVIRSHVIMSDHCRDITALWVVHTYVIRRFKISPKLSIRSPAKRCGKTTLLEVLAELVFRAWTTGSITKAALFRVIDKWHPTLLIDEVDTFVGEDEELRGILNTGHRYDGSVTRTVGDDHEPRKFSVYAAVALSGIGGLAETLTDRSVTADLKRRRPSETIARLRIGRMEHLHELRRRIVRWVADHEDSIAERDPEMPGFIDREADNLHVLLAIADEAQDAWPTRARNAAEQAHVAEADDNAAQLERLLGDIRDTFTAKGTQARDMFGAAQIEISSADLVQTLVAIENRPWAEMGKSGKPLTKNRLARWLKPLGIGPKNVGPEDARVRGYIIADFKEVFERYLSPDFQKGGSQPPIRPERDEIRTSDISKPHSTNTSCADVKCEKHNNDGLLGGWAVAKGKSGEEGHQPLGTCAQCRSLTADAPLVTGDGYPPAGVHLHEQCRKFWLSSPRVGRERFRMVDDCAPGTYCCHCHSPKGDVARWVDTHVVGCKSEPLHADCCARWWRDA